MEIVRQISPYGMCLVKDAPVTEHTRFKVEDVDTKEGIVTAYGSSFNVIDSYREYTRPGTFIRTINEWGPKGKDRIKHLMDHNHTKRAGKIIDLAEDTFGLRFRSKLSRNEAGRNALIEYSEGLITEHSIGYDVVKWERDEDRDALALIEVKLFEISSVMWGANPETPVIDLKNLQSDPRLLDTLLMQMRAIRRVMDCAITDERAIELEQLLKNFTQVTTELERALMAGPPQEGTHKDADTASIHEPPPCEGVTLQPLIDDMRGYLQKYGKAA